MDARTTAVFSGIIEATSEVLFVTPRENLVEVVIARPPTFDDVALGDSLACNGVCLTVEGMTEKSLQFSLGYESVKVLQIKVEDPKSLVGQKWNLERSLRFGDRVHGHLVTGHVEALGRVVKNEAYGDSWLLEVEVPGHLGKVIWPKGSLALHGVSLTVNSFKDSIVGVCLIPETVKRTNLAQLRVGDCIHIETDYLAKAYFQGRDHGL